MPAIVYGKAFVVGADKRLLDTVAGIEATTPMASMYITCVDDIYRWCTRNLVDPTLNAKLVVIDTFYGSSYASAGIFPP